MHIDSEGMRRAAGEMNAAAENMNHAAREMNAAVDRLERVFSNFVAELSNIPQAKS